jgi:Glycosyltransferase 61
VAAGFRSRSSRWSSIRARELDVSSAPRWDEEGPVVVLELWPGVEVDRLSALVEASVQPGVSSRLAQRRLASMPGPSFAGPAGRLVRLEDGMLESRICVAASPRFGFVGDSVRKGPKKLERVGYVLHETGELIFPDRRVVSVDFPAVNVALPYRHNYFRWMFEGIGGLLTAREFIPRDVRVVVRQALKPFEAETLAAVGVDPDSVFVLPANCVVQFPELYLLPRPATTDGALAPTAANAVRRLARYQVDSARPGRLYVTREESSRRRIVNHDEVLVTLARHGFSEVSAERLSVSEQIALFAQAEAVIGVHGAGLTNAVFSAPGTLLVELQPELRKMRPVYWNLAAVAGLRYVQVVCKSPTRRRHSDIEVDCSHLDAVLMRQFPVLGGSGTA